MQPPSLVNQNSDQYFAPKGKYLWDSWFLNTVEGVHAFYLCSPRDGDPEGRHHNSVSIGHAFSSDLYSWTDLGLSLEPSSDDTRFDSLSLWTGDIFEHEKTFYLYYTGRRKSEFWVQRIGLATSKDLKSFSRVNEFCLEADPRYYSTCPKLNSLEFPPAFRDPFILKDPVSSKFIMVFAARHKHSKDNLYNGCIGWAISDNLMDWEQQPPLLIPGGIDQLETPQLIYAQGYYYLLFSTWEKAFAKSSKYAPASGLHGFRCKVLGDQWEPLNGNAQILTNGEFLYDVRMVCYRQDTILALGWLNYDETGSFIGKLSKPIPFTLDGLELKPTYVS